jgi:D-lactate dehydrogenase
MDVFFYEAFEEEEKELRRFLPSNVNAGFTWKTIQESGHLKPPSFLISTRTQSIFPNDWGKELKAILSRSTGYDHLIDYQKRIDNKLKLAYLPLYCHRAVAEHALMLWMSLLRKLPLQLKNFPVFHRDGLTGLECEKKTLVIVGVGNIGGQIMNIGLGLNMNVLCVDLIKKYPEANYVSIEEGVAKADIIVCAMNLTDSNRNYFTYDLLRKSKKGTIFINISRGEFAPSSVLLKLLDEGHLGGVGIDVYDNEKELATSLRDNKVSNNPEVLATIELSKRTNAILTPHNAFNSLESVARKSAQSVEQVVNYVKTGEFLWNVPK